MKRYISKFTVIVAVLVLSVNTGCETLEVENKNLPDMARVLESPDDVRSVVQSSFQSYWQIIKSYNIGMTGSVTANHSTASWGNFAWNDMSREPRLPWNNDPSYGDSDLSEVVYNGLYATMSEVNDAITLILDDGMDIGVNGVDNPMILATAYLIRGLCHGQLGLSFDQAMIVRHDSDLAELDFQPWNDVIEAAIDDLKLAIQIAKDNSFEWGSGTVPGITINNTYIAQLANSYAARFIALGSRTKAQNESLSWTSYTWSDVIDFTNAGLTTDFAPNGNGLPWDGGNWYDLNIKYLRQGGWGRVDMRIVNMLDSDQPVRYPTDQAGLPTGDTPPNAGLAVSDDARLLTDFQYLASNNFNPARGGWHFSHYRYSRYDMPATTSDEGLFMGESTGPLRELRAYDNELMKAEAMARTGNATGAAAILNDASNPRKDRGELDDVSATEADVLAAIYYERLIELFHNGYLIGFCDTRRNDDLQWGTPLHWPVPGAELLALQKDIYTFGGVGNADGVNTSNGGAWIYDYYHFTPTWSKPSK